MSHEQSISPEELRELLDYDPETGDLLWKANRGNGVSPGAKAYLQKSTKGYLFIRVRKNGKRNLLRAHRVVWAIYYGQWPIHQLDHINGDPSDNRIANLREATNQENTRNQKKRANNKSGVTGVSWQAKGRRWIAMIGDSRFGTRRYLGCFTNFEEAVAARKAAEVEDGYSPLHGEDEAVRWLLG